MVYNFVGHLPHLDLLVFAPSSCMSSVLVRTRYLYPLIVRFAKLSSFVMFIYLACGLSLPPPLSLFALCFTILPLCLFLHHFIPPSSCVSYHNMSS